MELKDKLKPNMYVRYVRGAINGYVPPRLGKVIERINNSEFLKLDTNCDILENDVLKASYNIIDLIEVGDYVNGHRVYDINKDYIFAYNLAIPIVSAEDIKSIVTKEQFSSMEYKLGE